MTATITVDILEIAQQTKKNKKEKESISFFSGGRLCPVHTWHGNPPVWFTEVKIIIIIINHHHHHRHHYYYHFLPLSCLLVSLWISSWSILLIFFYHYHDYQLFIITNILCLVNVNMLRGLSLNTITSFTSISNQFTSKICLLCCGISFFVFAVVDTASC